MAKQILDDVGSGLVKLTVEEYNKLLTDANSLRTIIDAILAATQLADFAACKAALAATVTTAATASTITVANPQAIYPSLPDTVE